MTVQAVGEYGSNKVRCTWMSKSGMIQTDSFLPEALRTREPLDPVLATCKPWTQASGASRTQWESGGDHGPEKALI
jgi:hypothetical protein